MAMTATAMVTARTLMPKFLCIDLNKSPNSSSISLSKLDLWSHVGLDVCQSSMSPTSRGGTQTLILSTCLFTVLVSGYDRWVRHSVSH